MSNMELDIEYLDIQILNAEISNLTDKPLQRGDDFKLDHKVKVIHMYNLEKQLIRVILEIEIRIFEDMQEVKAGAKFEIDNYFHYKELETYASVNKDKILIETKFADLVKGLAYGTARGIVYSKLSGTFLEGTILPTIMSTNL